MLRSTYRTAGTYVRRMYKCYWKLLQRLTFAHNGCGVYWSTNIRSASRYVFWSSGMWADKLRVDCRSVGSRDGVYATVAQGNTANWASYWTLRLATCINGAIESSPNAINTSWCFCLCGNDYYLNWLLLPLISLQNSTSDCALVIFMPATELLL